MSRIKLIARPQGVFAGVNFMTPDVLGCYKLRVGYAELSAGTGMARQPIFGVTVRPDTDHARSQLFASKAEALAYIDVLS